MRNHVTQQKSHGFIGGNQSSQQITSSSAIERTIATTPKSGDKPLAKRGDLRNRQPIVKDEIVWSVHL